MVNCHNCTMFCIYQEHVTQVITPCSLISLHHLASGKLLSPAFPCYNWSRLLSFHCGFLLTSCWNIPIHVWYSSVHLFSFSWQSHLVSWYKHIFIPIFPVQTPLLNSFIMSSRHQKFHISKMNFVHFPQKPALPFIKHLYFSLGQCHSSCCWDKNSGVTLVSSPHISKPTVFHLLNISRI